MLERIDRGGWDDELEAPPRTPLTPAQAAALRAREPSISPWRVIAAQAVAGALVALLCWGVSGQGNVGWSALYGAAAVVVPGVVLARGIHRLAGASPAVAAVGFMVWEGVKVVLAVLLLLAAAQVVPDLSWPALLIALVVCVKVNWLALLWRGRATQES